MDENSYIYLKRKLFKLTGINLEYYKSQQMRRRLDAFFEHVDAKNVVDYGHMLGESQEKLRELLDFLTINVSEFFRDNHSFEQLKKEVLPYLLKRTPKLNIWSAGCSRGQECYSLVLTLLSISPLQSHRILATDIDASALRIAGAGGPYSQEDVNNVPARLYDKYFTGSGADIRVVDRIRQMVEFRQQNLLSEEFETGFDMIVCRNVTIYFTEDTKGDLHRKFFNSLKEGGVLFIGGTEVMLDASKIGFKGMGGSFYMKPEETTVDMTRLKENILTRV